jgi:hypothetical protein
MKNHLRPIKENESDPVIRGKALKVLGLPEDATPEEITMAFLRSHNDDPLKDHHRLAPRIRQLFKDWEEDRKQRKEALPEEKKKAA